MSPLLLRFKPSFYETVMVICHNIDSANIYKGHMEDQLPTYIIDVYSMLCAFASLLHVVF